MAWAFTQPYVGVSALVERDDKFLFIREDATQKREKLDHGKWNLPGGRLELGEDPAAAIIREVREETGGDFVPTAIIGVYSIIRKDIERQTGELPHIIKIVYLGTIAGQLTTETAQDTSDLAWFTADQILAMTAEQLRSLDLQDMVRDFTDGCRFPVDLIKQRMTE